MGHVPGLHVSNCWGLRVLECLKGGTLGLIHLLSNAKRRYKFELGREDSPDLTCENSLCERASDEPALQRHWLQPMEIHWMRSPSKRQRVSTVTWR